MDDGDVRCRRAFCHLRGRGNPPDRHDEDRRDREEHKQKADGHDERADVDFCLKDIAANGELVDLCALTNVDAIDIAGARRRSARVRSARFGWVGIVAGREVGVRGG